MKTPVTVLLVDDEVGFRENVAERLEARGFEVLHASEGESALEQVRGTVVDAALVDFQMPGMDGISLLGKLREIDPHLEAVIVTGQGSIELAVEAMQKGAYDFITKPVRLRELEVLVRKAIEKTALSRQNSLYREDLRRRQATHDVTVVAASDAMKRILEQAQRVASTDATVVIEGETGTGKEVIAEFIHRNSPRSDHGFSVLNCGALTETLVDAELFGHEKGAFTGATEARPGIFEVTQGGTLLLDEIGDMTAPGQIRLLRVLEKGLCRRVGSVRERSIDVRILAATHRNLLTEIQAGRFREDLYHRLKVFTLQIPPLRDRHEDIIPLTEHFQGALSPRKELAPDTQELLLGYSWPGNVRELAHTLQRASLLAQMDGADRIRPEHLGIPGSITKPTALISLEEAQARHIRHVLDHFKGNRADAARVLGVTERHLYRLLKKDAPDSD